MGPFFKILGLLLKLQVNIILTDCEQAYNAKKMNLNTVKIAKGRFESSLL
jgi:hypothetical protein